MTRNSWYLFVVVLLIDLFSKYLALSNFLQIEVIKNPGLPFVGKILPGFFDFILILFGLALFVFLYKKYFTQETDHAFALIVGGAISNIVDRLLNSGVTDFIDVGLGGKFNLADVAIWVGIVILIYSVFKKSDELKMNN